MEKTINIAGKDVTLKSTGSLPIRYKTQFKEDFFSALMKMEKAFNKGQIDFDAFPFARTGNWRDPGENIVFGCKVLSEYRQFLQSKTHLEARPLLQATVAAYNCGPGRVMTALQKQMDVDFYTAGRNYSRDVLNRTGWFQLQGWV